MLTSLRVIRDPFDQGLLLWTLVSVSCWMRALLRSGDLSDSISDTYSCIIDTNFSLQMSMKSYNGITRCKEVLCTTQSWTVFPMALFRADLHLINGLMLAIIVFILFQYRPSCVRPQLRPPASPTFLWWWQYWLDNCFSYKFELDEASSLTLRDCRFTSRSDHFFPHLFTHLDHGVFEAIIWV